MIDWKFCPKLFPPCIHALRWYLPTDSELSHITWPEGCEPRFCKQSLQGAHTLKLVLTYWSWNLMTARAWKSLNWSVGWWETHGPGIRLITPPPISQLASRNRTSQLTSSSWPQMHEQAQTASAEKPPSWTQPDLPTQRINKSSSF